MTDLPPDDDFDSSLALAVRAARSAANSKASDVLVLDVGDIMSITGYFVIVGASNVRQVRAVTESIEAEVRADLGETPERVEGLREQQWVLIDYGDVVVHVFLESVREFYEIERLFVDAPRIAWETPGYAGEPA